MALVVSDSFNRPNGEVGTADTGQAWQIFSGSPAIENAQLAVRTGTLGVNAGVADCVIQATNVLAADNAALYFRMQNNDNILRMRRSGTQLLLQKKIATVSTTVATLSANFPFADGDVWKVVCKGTTITCYVNDVQVGAPQTIPDLATQTIHGFGTFPSTTAIFDDFSVDDAVPGGGGSISGAGNVTGVSALGAAGGILFVADGAVGALVEMAATGTRLSPGHLVSLGLSSFVGDARAVRDAAAEESVAATLRGAGWAFRSAILLSESTSNLLQPLVVISRGATAQSSVLLGISASSAAQRSGIGPMESASSLGAIAQRGRTGIAQIGAVSLLTSVASAVFLPPSRNVVTLSPRLNSGIWAQPARASQDDGSRQRVIVPPLVRRVQLDGTDTTYND